jgi:hypothetical protein
VREASLLPLPGRIGGPSAIPATHDMTQITLIWTADATQSIEIAAEHNGGSMRGSHMAGSHSTLLLTLSRPGSLTVVRR